MWKQCEHSLWVRITVDVMLTEVLAAIQLFLLGMAVPLVVIAARGYRDAPFGAVLSPLPVVALGFAVTVVAKLLPLGTHEVYYLFAVGNTVGTVAAVVSAWRLVVLLTQRRRL